MKNAVVSIITPSFNSERYIAETIQSVIDQTFQDWEMIIIDDGSTDNTREIITDFVKKDLRIQLFPLENNRGAAKARNIGINQASGHYMTFLDADDIWFPDFIANSIKTINEVGIHFVFSSYKRANEKLEFVYSDFIVPQKVSYSDILKSNSISCLTAFIDIKTLGKKFMPEITKRQDMGLWLQYLKETPFAYGIQDTKAIYRIRKNSLSRNKTNLLRYQWQFYREIEKLNFFKSVYYMLHWIIRGLLKYYN